MIMIIYLFCVIFKFKKELLSFFTLRRHRQRVNFHIRKNETDRLEKMALTVMQLLIVSNGKKREKKKRERELQFNIRLHKLTQTKQ